MPKLDPKFKKFIVFSIRILENIISVLTILVLLALLATEIYKMVTVDEYFLSADTYLHNMLTIVVGLEFVRMLINLTTANTIEVLIVAIARQIIVNHADPIGDIACVLCIGGLFAIRKFLIDPKDLQTELGTDKTEDKN